jgi:hypothetical protein
MSALLCDRLEVGFEVGFGFIDPSGADLAARGRR